MRAAVVTMLALFVASTAVLAFEDRGSALLAVGFGAFQIVVLLVTLRCVPARGDRDAETLVATGSRPRVLARAGVVLAVTAVAYAYTFWYGHALHAPVFAALVGALARLAPDLGSGVPNLVLYAIVPGALLVVLGARPRELGLGRPANGTALAAAVCVLPFAIAWLVRVAGGAVTLPALGIALVHNALSNGFSEEFLFRGLWLAHARAFARSDWALLLQALAFAFLHLGTSLRDEPNALGVVANVIALNVPMGFVMGAIALRTRSIWLPAAIHLAYDTTRHVWSV